MPEGPRPPDVEFDDAAAADAISELDAARRLIVETEATRATSTAAAETDFAGTYADGFAEASTGLDAEASGLTEGIDLLRGVIERAVAAAAQQRRDVASAQAVWDAEAADERDLRARHPNLV